MKSKSLESRPKIASTVLYIKPYVSLYLTITSLFLLNKSSEGRDVENFNGTNRFDFISDILLESLFNKEEKEKKID